MLRLHAQSLLPLPAVWNKLSANAKTATTVSLFKSRIKTDFFSVVYHTYGSSAPS